MSFRYIIAVIIIGALPQGAIASGVDLYAEHCASCHGERLISTGAAPDLKLFAADQKAMFDKILTEGRGQMPSWEGVLTVSERDDIWSYIRSRSR